MKLVIDRKVWLRGDSDSYLLRDRDGRRCCVGIALQACGVPDSVMRGTSEVGELPQEVLGDRGVPAWMKYIETVDYGMPRVDDDEALPVERVFETNVVGDLYALNDNTALTDTEREPKIAAIFAKHGVEVEFR